MIVLGETKMLANFQVQRKARSRDMNDLVLFEIVKMGVFCGKTTNFLTKIESAVTNEFLIVIS